MAWLYQKGLLIFLINSNSNQNEIMQKRECVFFPSRSCNLLGNGLLLMYSILLCTANNSLLYGVCIFYKSTLLHVAAVAAVVYNGVYTPRVASLIFILRLFAALENKLPIDMKHETKTNPRDDMLKWMQLLLMQELNRKIYRHSVYTVFIVHAYTCLQYNIDNLQIYSVVFVDLTITDRTNYRFNSMLCQSVYLHVQFVSALCTCNKGVINYNITATTSGFVCN